MCSPFGILLASILALMVDTSPIEPSLSCSPGGGACSDWWKKEADSGLTWRGLNPKGGRQICRLNQGQVRHICRYLKSPLSFLAAVPLASDDLRL